MKKYIALSISLLLVSSVAVAENGKRDLKLSQTGAGSAITIGQAKDSKNTDTAKAKINFEEAEKEAAKKRPLKRKLMVSTSGPASSIMVGEREVK